MNKFYIDADALIVYANNQVNKTITANDIARFPIANVKEVEESEWILDTNAPWVWVDGEKTDARVCAKCGHVHLFNIVGRPILSKYCPGCGRYMINYDRYWENQESEFNEEGNIDNKYSDDYIRIRNNAEKNWSSYKKSVYNDLFAVSPYAKKLN